MRIQALQQLWEPARFTYQVNNPASQSQRPAGGSKQSAALTEAEEEEADSSSSDEQGNVEQPQQSSQVVTRVAEARSDHAGARSDYIWPLVNCVAIELLLGPPHIQFLVNLLYFCRENSITWLARIWVLAIPEELGKCK